MSAGWRSVIAGVLGRFAAPQQGGTGVPPIMCAVLDFDLLIPERQFDLQNIAFSIDLAIKPLTLNPEAQRTLDLAIPALTFDCGA